MMVVVAVARLVAFLTITLLPGTWLSFGLRLSDLGFWERLWTGAALSPIIVAAQYYLLRWLGAPFDVTCVLLVVLNLPVLLLITRRAGQVDILSLRELALLAAVAIVPVALYALYVGDLQFRGFSGHAWLHSDVIYQLANGKLRPEEPDLAGLRLGYPWLGYVQHAVQSYVLGTAPASNFRWVNVARLVAMLGLTWCIVARLGGSFQARVWSVILLLFGVNFCGYVARELLPTHIVEAYPIWGDWRYAPLIRQFYWLHPMTGVLPTIAALLLLSTEEVQRPPAWDRWTVIAVLLLAVGVTYPILFPAAAGVIAAAGLVLLLDVRTRGLAAVLRHGLVLAVIVVGSAVVTYVSTALITVDRVAPPEVGLSPNLWEVKRKSAEAVLALLPLILGSLWAVLVGWRRSLRPIAVAAMAGTVSAALYALIHIPHYFNEYKFITTAALALAPLAGLGIGSLFARLRHGQAVLLVVGALVLSAPGFHRKFRWDPPAWSEPLIDGAQFDLRLDPRERYAGITTAIREETPVDAVLVAADPGLHLPTVTRRAMFAPYEDVQYPGINVPADDNLRDVRGYDPQLILARRATLKRLFAGRSDADRTAALAEIRRLARPTVIVVDESKTPAVADWIEKTGATLVYAGRDLSAWILPAAPGPRSAVEERH